MPDIFRGLPAWEEEEPVRIPDVPSSDAAEEPVDPAPPPEEPEGGGAAEGGTAPEEETAQPPPKPEVVPVAEPPRMSRAQLADYYRAELNDIREEAAQQARKDAYAAALAECRQRLADSLSQVDLVLGQMESLQWQFMEEYARELKYLALEIAEKLIQTKLPEDDRLLANLVLQSVNQVKKAEWLKVEVSDQLAGLVDYLKTEFAKAEYQGKVEVVAAPWPEDTCQVISEDGAIVATVSVQAENLRQTFLQSEQDKGQGGR